MHTSSHHGVVGRRPPRQPLVGRCLNDRYALTSVIAEGASSVVYAAHDSRTGGEVAIKAAHEGPRGAEAVRRERLAARVVHPFVCAVRDWGDVDGTPCTVLERIVGETLRSRLGRGRVSAKNALEIVISIVTALDGIHGAGLVHRDVKPSNVVLVEGAGRRPLVKLIDFSLAQERTETSATSTPVGSPPYMSPEQTRGELVGPSSDLFSAGLVLFEVLAGQHPFATTLRDEATLFRSIREQDLPSVRERRPELPLLIDDVVAQATKKEPSERYPSAAAMALELEVCLAELRRR